jgi:RNA polymerase sigma-70 factor (ECF subfamily)
MMPAVLSLAIVPLIALGSMDAPSKPTGSGLDTDLLARVAAGDQGAFGRLYDQSSTLLFALAFRVLGDREAAADLLQDVYLEVWNKRVAYDADRGSPTAWLVTMTRSRAIDRLRSRTAKGHGVTDSLEQSPAMQLPDQNPSPLEASAGNEIQRLVGKALAELPPPQRQALELAYYQGLSHSEIAAKLNEPLGTVKTRIKLGMDKLKTVLRPCWEP